MPVSFLEVEPRSFKPMSVPGLTNEAREAANAALKAMSTWRNEMADTSEKNGKQVIESMAKAASALGWPQQLVDACPHTDAEHLRNADQNDGSHDGRLG